MKYLRLFMLFLPFLLLFGTGCSRNRQLAKSSEAYLKKGDYYQASIMAIKSLQLNSANQKAQELLHYSHPRAVEKHLISIQNLKSEKQAKNWPAILDIYLELQELNDDLQALPALYDPFSGSPLLFDVQSYSVQILEAKQESAEYFYRKGMHYSLQSANKDVQKQAAAEFKKAMEYLPDYKDAQLRYQEARQKATHRIAVLPFEDKSGSAHRYGALGDIMAESVISALLQDAAASEYLQIINRDQIDRVIQEQELAASGLLNESSSARLGQLLGVDEILSGKILQIDYKAPRTVSVDITSEGKSSKDELQEADKAEPAACVYTKYQKTASLKAMVSYYVIDVSTGKIQTQNSLNGSCNFETEWARYQSGDKSVLSSQEKALIEKAEGLAPSDKEMINRVLSQISLDIKRELSQYLK